MFILPVKQNELSMYGSTYARKLFSIVNKIPRNIYINGKECHFPIQVPVKSVKIKRDV